MNPFALDGPLFNLFYALFAAIVLLLLYAVRRAQEAGPLPRIELKDPYLMACLNGGPAACAAGRLKVRLAVLLITAPLLV